jgi:hypothetical protein
MRKWRYELAAPGLGLAGLATVLLLGAAPAFADVEVNARISKTLDMTVTEHITVTKNVFLDAEVEITASKFAESDATANQGNDNVHACENCAERTDTLSGAGNNNHGVTTINQAGGNLNNQGSAVSAAIDVGTGPPGPNPGPADPTIGFAESSAAANQHNGGAPVEGDGGFNSSVQTVNVVFRDALITGSIMSNTGIIYVNQSVGNVNNQANELSLAFSKKPGGVALSEADLGQTNTNVLAQEGGSVGDAAAAGSNGAGVFKTATISGSVIGNTGIVGVNQASGNFANQANIVSFAAVTP